MTDSGAKRATLRGSVRLLVVGVVLLTALVTAAVAIGLQYYFSRAMAIDAAVAGYQQTARHTGEFIQAIDRRATQITRLLARYPQLALPAIPGAGEEQALLALFAQAMRNNPIYFSMYLGLPNGDFLEVVNLESSQDMRELLKAQPDERWLVNRVYNHQGQRIRQLDYFAADMGWRRQRQEPSNYDVRQRRWYSDTRDGAVNKTLPYVFNYPQVPGQTYSMRLPGSQVVLGIDITLQTLSDYLRQQPLGSTGELYLYKASGEILASNRLGHSRAGSPVVAPMALTPSEQAYIRQLGSIKVSNQMDWPPIDFAVAGQPRGYGVELLQLAAARLGLELNFINGYSWAEILANFAEGELDMIQPVTDSPANRTRGYLSQPVMRLPLALALRSQDGESLSSLSLAQLRGKTLAIPRGWSSIEAIRRAYPDISILEVASPRAALEAVRDGRAYATLDSSAVLHYTANQYFMEGLSFIETVDTGAASLPTEFRLLLRPGLQGLGKLLERAIAGLDATQVAQLQHKWLLAGANPGERFISVPYKPLLDAVQQPQQQYQPLQLELAGQPHLAYVEPLNPDDANSDYFAVVVPAAQVLGDSLKRVSLSLLFTGAGLLLVLPLAWLLAEGIVRPVRQLHDKSIKVKERRYSEITYSPSLVREIDELLQSMVTMAQSIQHYEQEQRRLMDAFIELIAEAIDEKSPYTGGHCERVPTLALMLVEKAAATGEGPLADFGFSSEEEEREFRIAAWLHDCGKITVPEHIVDKGSKLETIYNRIHEIRMRFEVLWRDAEIAYLQAVAQQPADAERLRLELERQRRQLQADFAFVAATNVGGEFLSDEARQRLRELGAITWVRYFDDRLGLSPVEELRLAPIPARPLPATEPLLADRPEHLIQRQRPLNYDPAWGIQVQPPEYLYNLGEIYNLSIARGTLTAEDRFKINEHIISTIRMLEKLPFPDELKRVPRYASTHHETMKGTGYPRQLHGDQLSVPERIMVVADIFEALTAADRPYKKAKTLSESLAIMHRMVQEQHIDADIFELLLTSGVYRDYAQRYLTQAQIDAVDIRQYLRQPGPAQEKD